MLPLSLLQTSLTTPILLELKTGETYNGILTSIDAYMNLNLTSVIVTSKDGASFKSLETVYVRGNGIKFLRVGEGVLDECVDNAKKAKEEYAASGRGGGRGGGEGGRGDGGRGRGRGRGRDGGGGRSSGGRDGGGRGRGGGGRFNNNDGGGGRGGGGGRFEGGRGGGGRTGGGRGGGGRGRGNNPAAVAQQV